jgi:segregation and condensation protein A
MTEETAYRVKIEVFEGPFDILLKGIDSGEIDIFRVSLSEIVNSYFEYWKKEEPNLLMASDFLYMAAYLIEIKARELLPYRDNAEVDEQLQVVEESLVAHIQEYEIYKKLAQGLKQRKEVFERIYGRHEGEELEKEIELVDVSLRDLVLAFQRVYAEAAERERVVPIEAEPVTLEERIVEIRRLTAGRKDGIPFEDLFFRKTRIEIVVTFLAILELARQRSISIRQGRQFGSILIFAVPVLEQGRVSDGTDQN